MENITYEYFKKHFGTFTLKIIKIKKYFFKKYILFEIHDGVKIDSIYVEKCTDDLKKMYKSIKEHFPNFPITDKHDENVVCIMNHSKDDWLGQHFFILEFLYAFIFKSKNHTNIERPKVKTTPMSPMLDKMQHNDSFSDDQNTLNVSSSYINTETLQGITIQDARESIEQRKSEDDAVLRKKIMATNLKASGSLKTIQTGDGMKQLALQINKDRCLEVFDDLFSCAKNTNSTSYPRILLFKKKLLNLFINKNRSEPFNLKFKFSNEPNFYSRYVIFTDKIMYMYDNGRDYIRDRDSFLEALFLVKVDRIKFNDFGENETFIELINECNLVNYQLIIPSAGLHFFLLTMCIQLLREESCFIKTDMFPHPFNCLGDFVLKIEEKVDESKTICEDDKMIKIQNSFFQMVIKNCSKVKRLIIPIFNQLDIIYLRNQKKTESIEMTKIFDLNFDSEHLSNTYQFLNIYVRRLSDYTDAFISPILENYHENRPIESGFRNAYKELQITTFRLKRLFAYRDFMFEKWTEFLCFKYPLFTSMFFIISLIFVLSFSFDIYMVLACLVVIFYFNPFLNGRVSGILNSLFFKPNQLNKCYINPRHLQERTKRKLFYMNQANLEKKYEHKVKLSEKIINAYDFSSRVPVYIHTFIDYFEKVKNLIMWKNYRKTEACVFYFISLSAVLYFTNKEAAFVYWVIVRTYYGHDYYKRLKVWNEKVITFLVRYFINDILEKETETAEEFFVRARLDLTIILDFSKKFNLFVEKWLDIKLPDEFWKNHFSLEQIVEELLYSQKRIILPFYEEKRKPGMTDMMINFLYSTPSDYYYYMQSKVMVNGFGNNKD